MTKQKPPKPTPWWLLLLTLLERSHAAQHKASTAHTRTHYWVHLKYPVGTLSAYLCSRYEPMPNQYMVHLSGVKRCFSQGEEYLYTAGDVYIPMENVAAIISQKGE